MPDREIVRQALEEIASAGPLTPTAVWKAAKAADHPLHDCFTWNIREAAEKHWEDQARALIRSVKVKITTNLHTVKVPVWVHDPELPPGEAGYVTLSRLRSSEEAARETLIAEVERVIGLMRRLHAVAAELDMIEAVKEIEDRMANVIMAARRPPDRPAASA